MKRQGRKSKAQTPAPKSERIKGSSKNPTGTASSKKSAESIKFSPEIISVLEKKKDEYNKKHESKVSLATLKAVFRRGAGAYSSSHRPTITGGMPNSRTAWAYARVNAFLRKKSGGYAKKSYVQDDDLFEKGGQVNDLINQGIVELRMFNTTPEHSKEYGLNSKNPLYVQSIYISKDYRLKGIGSQVFEHIIDYAKKNQNDLIFGHITQKAEPNLDVIKKILNDKGFTTIDGNNDFYKIIDTNYSVGGKLKNELVEKELNGTIKELGKKYYIVKGNYKNIKKHQLELIEFLKGLGYEIFDVDKASTTNSRYFNFEKWDISGQIRISDHTKPQDRSLKPLDEQWRDYTLLKVRDFYGSKSIEIEILTSEDFNYIKEWFMNTTDTYAKGGDLPVGRLAKGMSLSEVAEYHGLKASDLKKELAEGIKTEMEHTTTPEIARAIALDHLYENPKYYTKLKMFESHSNKYAKGGETTPEYSFKTPTGEKTKLNYLQQVLVRTKGFKQFFGDWELAAQNFLSDGRQNFEKYYKNVSKVIDYVTLEPRVVYHGTRTEEEFFTFDVTQDKISGRPYGYFAHNREYSENFLRRGYESISFLYNCFLNVRNPFYATDSNFRMMVKDANEWKQSIYERIALDRYGSLENTSQVERLKDVLDTQIGLYINKVFENNPFNFWLLMARDVDKDFKMFLITYGYDGVFYDEQFTDPYDPNNPREHTNAITIFSANQVKLADGRNLNFDPLNNDIRYDDGGKLESESTQKTDEMTKKSMLRETLFGKQKFAEGGTIKTNQGKTDDGKKGGYFSGRSHAEGGIKAINVDTGQLIEVEGQEVIITKDAVNDPKKRLFEGKMMTNKEILSKINQSGGGVSFAEGGEVNGGHCGCSGKKYNFGGQLLTDFDILNTLSTPQRIIEWEMNFAKSFMDDLTLKMK